MTEKLKELGKERIIEENKKLKPMIEKMLAKKKAKAKPEAKAKAAKKTES